MKGSLGATTTPRLLDSDAFKKTLSHPLQRNSHTKGSAPPDLGISHARDRQLKNVVEKVPIFDFEYYSQRPLPPSRAGAGAGDVVAQSPVLALAALLECKIQCLSFPDTVFSTRKKSTIV